MWLFNDRQPMRSLIPPGIRPLLPLARHRSRQLLQLHSLRLVGTFGVDGMVIALLQQCRVHKNRVRLSAWIARHIVFDKKKGDHLPNCQVATPPLY